jgi:hypothetical protein
LLLIRMERQQDIVGGSSGCGFLGSGAVRDAGRSSEYDSGSQPLSAMRRPVGSGPSERARAGQAASADIKRTVALRREC